MTIQLIGAGLGRTGTMSLKLALEQLLGGTCHHMMEVFGHPDEIPVWHAAMRDEPVDFTELLAGYEAIVDYPGAAVWRDLADAFPDAPILLSTRSSARTWYDSAAATIFASRNWETADDTARRQRAMIATMFDRSLGADLDDADAVMAAYDAHNAAVRAEVPADRLFEYQPGDGWAPLCAALGVPIPDVDFPHENTREQFRARAGLDT
jgi:Sulfotransferase domain